MFITAAILFVVFTCVFSGSNIILVVTDDQDVALGGLVPMRNTRKLLEDVGTSFSNAYVTTPVCCPARASLLTGLYQHNHGVYNNSRKGGCDGARWQNVFEPRSLGPVLQAAGYRTFYTGKYLNQYQGDRVPPGWDWWAVLKGNSVYYNYTLNINGTKREFGDQPRDYLTDVLSELATDFLKIQHSMPFLMVVAPPAPHEPFTPSVKYEGHFSGLKAPRIPNFNTGWSDKHWLVGKGPSLPPSAVHEVDNAFIRRWETLLSVDDLVTSVVKAAPSDTYIMFTSDHGFHLGQFAQPWDKRQPYETDIRVPFLVKGPGVPAGAKIANPVLNLDIAPTLYDIAGVTSPPPSDGYSFLPLISSQIDQSNHPVTSPSSQWDRSFLIEYQGEGGDGSPCFDDPNVKLCSPDLACHCFDARNNTFTCVRRVSPKRNTLYCQFRDSVGFTERYDLNTDPFQMINLAQNLDIQ